MSFKKVIFLVQGIAPEKELEMLTPQTPNNSHTKGSLKFKNVTVEIENGAATIS